MDIFQPSFARIVHPNCKRIPLEGKISKQTKNPNFHIFLPVANSLHPSAITAYSPACFDLVFFKQLGCLTSK